MIADPLFKELEAKRKSVQGEGAEDLGCKIFNFCMD
jgi:hypothetical protein